MRTKEFVVSFEDQEVTVRHLLSTLALHYPSAGVRVHDLSECAEKHKEEGEEYFAEATKRVGW